MAFGRFESRKEPMTEINVVPLVDVMLVLLVIFIITAPLLTNSVKIDLPKAPAQANPTRAEHIEFSVREDGQMFWNGDRIDASELPARFAAQAAQQPQPELHIHADRLAHYELVAKVLADASTAGLSRIGFVTLP